MTTAEEKITKHLETAHAIELALVQTLTANIAMTPEGEYRSLLERHLQETNEQSQRLRQRLTELGASKSPVDVVRGTVEAIVGQVLSAAKAPVDILRGGPSGEEKLLRNARDQVTTEALEIATYDVIEALAEEAGDSKTATLAREHRTQEEVTLKQLREVIPALARDAFRADVDGERTFDPSETGAAQAGKSAAAAAGRAARDAGGRLQGAAASARATAEDVVDDAEDTLEDAADRVRGAAGEVTDAASGSGAGDDDGPPIEGFDRLSVADALLAIDGLDGEDLGRIEAYERTTKSRKTVLDRIQRRRLEAAGV